MAKSATLQTLANDAPFMVPRRLGVGQQPPSAMTLTTAPEPASTKPDSLDTIHGQACQDLEMIGALDSGGVILHSDKIDVSTPATPEGGS